MKMRSVSARSLIRFPAAAWITDEEGRCVFANRTIESLLGIEPGSAIGKTPFDLYPEPEAVQHQAANQRVLRTGKVVERIERYVRSDGTQGDAVVVKFPMNDRAGRRFVGGVAVDITGQRSDEERIKLLGAALANSANGIFITDADGRIEWVNRAFTDLSGYSTEELIGAEPRLLKTGMQDAAFYERLWQTIQAGHVWTGEVTERRKDGSVYIVAQTITPMRDGDGQVRRFVAIHEDITARKQAESKLEHLARHDVLTGLPNRELFRQRLGAALEQAQRSGTLVAVHYLDLDRFKQVNDTLGHGVGDALLRAVGERLLRCLRSSDTVARLGGDEFALLQTNLQRPTGASIMAAKVVQMLGEPFQLQGREVRTSTSVGITLFPGDETDIDAILHNADLAMYRAKQRGRSNFQFYTPDLNAAVQARMTLEMQIRSGLDEDQFVLYYQPQVEMLDGRIRGVEALLRWRHTERGILSPGDFLPVAEESGLIMPLTHRVLTRACAQKRIWLEQGLDTGRMAVNLSAAHFPLEDLAERVRETLELAGLEGKHLSLEITETALMRNGEATERILERLHAQGVQLAIDDFGTGYSSMCCLGRYPVDRLKIDRSFLVGLGRDDRDTSVVARHPRSGTQPGQAGRRRRRGTIRAGYTAASGRLRNGAGLPVCAAAARRRLRPLAQSFFAAASRRRS